MPDRSHLPLEIGDRVLSLRHVGTDWPCLGTIEAFRAPDRAAVRMAADGILRVVASDFLIAWPWTPREVALQAREGR